MEKNRKPYRQLIKKEILQGALDTALADEKAVNYNDNTSLHDLETVDYNNDTSVTDLVLVRKLKTIKEDENDNIEVIKSVQRVLISDDDDDDIEFLKQRPYILGTDSNVQRRNICKDYRKKINTKK